jgi:DNA polymerase-3 subunit epsilon
MGWFARWQRRPDSEVASAAQREWQALPEPTRGAHLDTLRCVGMDTETSGLDPERDRLIAVGACSIDAGSIRIGECFAATLRQEQFSSSANVLIHGIGHGAQAAGEAPDQALAAYLRFARRDVLIGYHTAFDLTVMRRCVRATLGIDYRPPALDLALLLPALAGKGSGWTLDQWLQVCGLRAFARHHALADAVATAELFLVALQQARARGLRSLSDLLRLQAQQLELARFGRG